MPVTKLLINFPSGDPLVSIFSKSVPMVFNVSVRNPNISSTIPDPCSPNHSEPLLNITSNIEGSSPTRMNNPRIPSIISTAISSKSGRKLSIIPLAISA